MSPPHYEYDKAFLVAAHSCIGIDDSILAMLKALGISYNRRETRDKRPLGRDPDRSWCHCHTSVKIFLVTTHGSMDIGGSIRVCCHSVRGSIGDQESFTLVWR